MDPIVSFSDCIPKRFFFKKKFIFEKKKSADGKKKPSKIPQHAESYMEALIELS